MLVGMALQVARGRAIIPANKNHTELEPTIIGAQGKGWEGWIEDLCHGDHYEAQGSCLSL